MKLIFFVILMVGLAHGQDSTVTQVVERFTIEMNNVLDDIVSFQVQVDSLKHRIVLLEMMISNSDISTHTVTEIDQAVDIILPKEPSGKARK